MPQSKHWTFTLNNYDEHDEQAIKSLYESGQVQYYVFGRELGEEGTPHLQGFISFKTRKRFETVKRLLGDRYHIEQRLRNSTNEKAAAYCKKDGDFIEEGVLPPERGQRTDLEAIASDIRDGKRSRDIAREHPTVYIKYHRGIERLQFILDTPRRWVTTNFVFYGKTGTGKTHRVRSTEGWTDDDVFVFPAKGWYDGYSGQEAALFDEFGGHQMSVTEFLRITDQYPMMVPVKGGFVQWKPKRCYFCSNVDPADWWTNITSEQQAAVDRRLHIILKFNGIQNTIRQKPYQ